MEEGDPVVFDPMRTNRDGSGVIVRIRGGIVVVRHDATGTLVQCGINGVRAMTDEEHPHV